MKSKEKRKVLLIIILLLIIGVICIFYSLYANRLISYASNDKITYETVQISKAQKVDIEKIIKENQQDNREQIITENVDLEYITEYKNNNELPVGTIQVIQEGRTGIQQITTKRTWNENYEMQEEQINSIIIKAAINKVVEIGTAKNKGIYKVTKGSNIYVTSGNTEMKVLEISDNWYKISVDGQTGWIKSENVTSVNPNPTYQEENNIITKCDFNMALNKPSGLTLEQFKKVLNDSKDVNRIFSENAEYFYYIEKQYSINGIFVAAIGIHESAWGTSKIAINKKNLFGYGAYDSSPYSSSYSFSTYSEGIDLIARVLVKYYLNPNGTAIYGNEIANGKYYNGNTISAVNQKYATDKNWANKVYKYMEYLYKKI